MRLLLVLLFICTVNAKVFHFANKLSKEVWVGCLGNYIKQRNYVYPALNNGGWILPPGGKSSVIAQDDWQGRFWGRTGCSPTNNHCDTGACGDKLQCNGAGGNPPATLAEIFLNQGNSGHDFYDISLVDGFNIGLSIEPLNSQGDGSKYSCTRCACRYNILPECPAKLKVTKSGSTIACNSACNALDTDLYCCRNAHNTPRTCRSTDWPVNYAKFYKDRCPDAYSYAYDDRNSTFTCNAKEYLITFGV